MQDGRKTVHTYSQPDLIIAATAAHHRMTVVTRDPSQFLKASVPVLNPWNPAAPLIPPEPQSRHTPD